MCKAPSQAATVARDAIRRVKNPNVLLSIVWSKERRERENVSFYHCRGSSGKKPRKTLKASALNFIVTYRRGVRL